MSVHRYRILLCAACCLALALVAGLPCRAAAAAITITTVDELQKIGNDPSYPLDGAYELGGDIDASATSSWNSGAGFIPICNDNSSTPFTGSFDGKGHVIRGLYINRPDTDTVGLFGVVVGGFIANIGLDNATVTGRDAVGGLVGTNEIGSIINCSIRGSVTGGDEVGGLVGVLSEGNITNCTIAGSVTGTDGIVGGLAGVLAVGSMANSSCTAIVYGKTMVGGLAGELVNSNLINSYCTGSVTGSDVYTGGLIGLVTMGNIGNSYCTGAVTGSDYVGGLAGLNTLGYINSSYNTGTVTGDNKTGGLVGFNSTSSINNCYNTGAVTGDNETGGLVGYDLMSSINSSYNTGAVTGDNDTGGLVGNVLQGCSVSNSYSTGAVTGIHAVGGLVGSSAMSAISNSYSAGAVTGSTKAGGLMGYSDNGSVIACFWDNQTSGQTASAGGTGRNTAGMKARATFTDAGWNFATVWGIVDTKTYPFFLTNTQPVAVPDNYKTRRNKTLTVAAPGVLANDISPDNATITAALVSAAANGTVSLSDNGSFTYESNRGFTGEDVFVYTANAGGRVSEPVTVTIMVGRKKLCPAVKLYGEGSAEVMLLRAYRDRVLAQTVAGRLAITLYYSLAPMVDTMLDVSPALGQKTRSSIDLLLPVLQRSITR